MSKYYVLIFLAFSLYKFTNGQDTTTSINEIRQMYQQTMDKKPTYTTKEKDITWEAFSGEDDSYSEATLTKYYSPDKELKIITMSFFSSGQYSNYKRSAELFYNNDTLYFLYSERKRSQWKEVYEQKGKTTSVTEERVYFNKNGECIRYLIKEVDGKPEEIEILLNAEPNIEIDCLDAEELIKNIRKYLQ
jgi:hypothetical protein